MHLKFREAIQFAEMNGNKDIRKELGLAMLPNSAPRSQTNRICNLQTKFEKDPAARLSVAWVKIICEKCNVTPNFLFGYEKLTIK